jgi:hypothetical protein
MDRVVTFVGGPYQGQQEYRHDVPQSIDKPGPDGQVLRYVLWAMGSHDRQTPATRQSAANATYVLEGMSAGEVAVELRKLSVPPFVTSPDP